MYLTNIQPVCQVGRGGRRRWLQPRARTQAERREETRAKLLEAGRRLFEERGYEAVGTPEIVAAAGVTRGALYHHFDGKRELFAAVYEAIEAEIVASLPVRPDGRQRSVRRPARRHRDLPGALARRSRPAGGAIDAPVGARLGGLARGAAALRARHRRGGASAAIAAGQIRALPIRALANALLGALIEAALSVAWADPIRGPRWPMPSRCSRPCSTACGAEFRRLQARVACNAGRPGSRSTDRMDLTIRSFVRWSTSKPAPQPTVRVVGSAPVEGRLGNRRRQRHSGAAAWAYGASSG